MKFWDYIAGFFLFRWLFGSGSHDNTGCNEPEAPGAHSHDDIIDASGPDFGNEWRHNGYYDNCDYGDPQPDDDFLDDPDDFIDDDF